MKNVDNMSTKPLNKYNKSELYQLAKDNKDDRKAFIFKIDTLDKQYSDALSETSILRDRLRQCKEEKKILQTNINRYAKQKKLSDEDFKISKSKVGKGKISKEKKGFCKTFFDFFRRHK